MTQANVSQTKNAGCLTAIGLFVAGWVLPCFSPKFYAEAMQRRARSAIGFFVMFTLVLTLAQSLAMAGYLFVTTSQAINGIFNSYASGQAPVVTITNGVADVSGVQPRVFADEQRTFVAFDTSGAISSIDRQKYLQGFLLTRTSAIILYQGFYQEIKLSDLQKQVGSDPLILNSVTVSGYWASFAAGLWVLLAILLALWNTVIRFSFIFIMALLIAGVLALVRPSTGFRPVLITGLYAVVPTTYLRLLFSFGFDFPDLSFFILLPLWAIALFLAFRHRAPVLNSAQAVA